MECQCPKRVTKATSSAPSSAAIPNALSMAPNSSSVEDKDEGFVEVKNQRNKKKSDSNRYIAGGLLNMVEEDDCGPSFDTQKPSVNEPFGDGSSKADDVKVQEEDSLWRRFQRSKNQKDDSDEDSEVEEYPPHDSTGISSTGGGFSLEDDDFDCYDGYDA
ncbi:hypothetical protein Tco_0373520 [Tanacetum coccineum]